MYAIHAHAHLHLPLSQCSVRGAFDRISISNSKRRNKRAVLYSRKMSYFYLPNLAKGMVLKPAKALPEDERAEEDAEKEAERVRGIKVKALTEDERAAEEAEKEAERIRGIKEDWVIRGWAPWEHVLSPEADFAIKSIEDIQDDDMLGLRTEEALEAFKRITPKSNPENYDKKNNMVLPPKRTLRIGDEDYELVPHTNQWGQPEPNETMWNSPLVFTLIPPRDWPPPGWHVDAQELAFIREAHKLESVRVDPAAFENPLDDSNASFPRFELFLKQYNHWVAANKDRLEKEAAEVDEDYHPGRRRTGSKYIEGMYELPFVYPGQIYGGHVTCVHLYQGAFVFIGCVHDGWVPIKGNDWYWIRHHIKVGMHVQVEVVAKRDPFRYRFPIELRFVNPNIDHLIFNKFEFPPIFGHNNTTAEELSRETGRPYTPRRRPSIKPEDHPLSEIHPYSKKIGQIQKLEEELFDDEDDDPNEEVDEEDEDSDEEDDDPNEKKEDLDEEDEDSDEQEIELVKLETDNKIYDSDNDGYWIQSQFKGQQIAKLVLTVDEKDLDMDAARAEREIIYKLKKESKAQGKMFEVPTLRREKQMDEFDAMHKQRSIEEREALIRDISCRLELGLPIEEPGRYADDDLWNDVYTTWNPKFRNDYSGDTSDFDMHNPRKRTYVRSRGPVKKAGDNLPKSPSTNVQNVVNNGTSNTTGIPKKENSRNDDSKRGRGAAESDTEDK
ncbi:protein PLASTID TRANSCRIPTIONALLY ACTIVE 10 isoform X2 [Cryptomeria japonica]|uniref:protein PLASTID TRANSCRIPTIONALLY ACTIVE 10 isoform X2 n=1 Tax=Cryptomeria japonica TaxID=3369 RepID=UPI0025AC187B|nr:protein PLASTID TRANSCRIPTIONALLY ACTIVE 10 isoform X2 [Cryptomeria japonica]